MDGEDIDTLTNLFNNDQSVDGVPVQIRTKPTYIPVSLPSTIVRILETWSYSAASPSSCRVGIGPSNPILFNNMFEHIWSESHVEQPYRLSSIIEYLHKYLWLSKGVRWRCFPGRIVTDDEIRLVHSETFLKGFLAVEHGETVDDNPSMRTLSYANATYNFNSVGPIIARACRTAAGTVLDLLEAIVRGDIDLGFALIRPAGHHSSRDQVGTFCGLNSVALSSVYAIEILKLDRVLILDWDVHRSAGTEQILSRYSNENEQHYRLIDIYAAFGKVSNSSERSSNCILIDLYDRNHAPSDNEYLNVFDFEILPNIIEFHPSLIFISAGFDAAQGEAEECANLTPNGYYKMTKKLKELGIPLLFVLEGGYQEQSLVQSTTATIEALLDI